MNYCTAHAIWVTLKHIKRFWRWKLNDKGHRLSWSKRCGVAGTSGKRILAGRGFRSKKVFNTMNGFVKDKGLNATERVQTAPEQCAICREKGNLKASPFYAYALL
ncbi:hypothetical protein T4D_5669 [Trichinella pseudospiralis]|uniref:Uncharacterized protein n=1 Tax=Trichinella pseudospiralis TaxID=6337 RepID=A0A0V1FX47_TRIPS|nr:hypothetical protein T4D_5669 [Trichinella pseudospiralis]